MKWACNLLCALLVGGAATTARAQPAEPSEPKEPAPPTPAPPAAPAPPEPALPAPAAPSPAPTPRAPPAAPAPSATPGPKPIVDFFPLSGARASFPLIDGQDPLVIEGHLSVYAQYVLSVRSEAESTDWYHAFELPRAHARIDASFEGARARVLVEAVRSASEGALVGVAGDSFVFRVREAWGAYTAWDIIETRLGLVPTLTVGPIETMQGLRIVGPTAIERTGLSSPADLGGTVRGFFPKGFGWIGAGAYNGEGYAQRELNRGKNIEIAALVHPVAVVKDAAPLTVHASYTSGSSGTGLARSDRIAAALAWEGELLRGGVSFAYAWGLEGEEVEGLVFEAFARVRPIPRLSLGATGMYFQRDLDQTDDFVALITGSVGYFIVDPLAVFLAVDGQISGQAAEQEIVGLDDVRGRLIGAVEF